MTAGESVIRYGPDSVGNDSIAAAQNQPVCGSLDNGIATLTTVIYRIALLNYD